jgi:hypothetical protein
MASKAPLTPSDSREQPAVPLECRGVCYVMLLSALDLFGLTPAVVGATFVQDHKSKSCAA